uniref:C13 family peptidase n=1 Tax=Castellaniella defragrans TaxID=75697 RepID=UPI00333F822F
MTLIHHRQSIPRASWMIALAALMLAAPAAADSIPQCPPNLATLDLPNGGRYCGQLQNGKLHGHGRIDWGLGRYYEGEFRDGFMEGDGHLVQPARDLDYKGQFQRGELHGKGLWQQGDEYVYEGEFVQGVMEGQGRLALYKGAYVYEGLFKHDKLDGQARMTDSSGTVMEGQFKGYQPVGPVIMTWPTGDRYEGPLRGNAPHGKGAWTRADKAVVRGEFEYGDVEGKATITYPDGAVYTGSVNGQHLAEGKGELRRPNGDVYRGGFAEDQFDGQGILTKADGTTQAGYWRAGQYLDAQGDGTLENTAELAARNAEDALYNQQALLQKQFAALEPSPANGPARMYVLLVAGDGRQEIFRREVAWVDDFFARRFDTGKTTIRLVNSRSSVQQTPLATTHSIELALQALAQKMDRQRDLLFVYLTSHGSSEHELSLGLRGLNLPNLPAQRLAEMLKASGIRNQVVVISACYSGGFVPPLQGERTWVMTAARADRTSFGCADEGDFTYFGRALFKEALPAATTLSTAFQQADRLVAEWETNDAEKKQSDAKAQETLAAWLRAASTVLLDTDRSHPQSIVSPAFRDEVDAWFQAHPPIASANPAPPGPPGEPDGNTGG